MRRITVMRDNESKNTATEWSETLFSFEVVENHIQRNKGTLPRYRCLTHKDAWLAFSASKLWRAYHHPCILLKVIDSWFSKVYDIFYNFTTHTTLLYFKQ